VIARITDPFFTTRRESGGTGLGLAITDRIVRDHGGSLTFESSPGTGTTVRAMLPIETDDPNQNMDVLA
jgi:polar amino acid transport system substrate-binding protein